MIKTIIIDLGGVYFEAGTEIDKRLSSALTAIRNVPSPYKELLINWVEGYRISRKRLPEGGD